MKINRFVNILIYLLIILLILIDLTISQKKSKNFCVNIEKQRKLTNRLFVYRKRRTGIQTLTTIAMERECRRVIGAQE